MTADLFTARRAYHKAASIRRCAAQRAERFPADFTRADLEAAKQAERAAYVDYLDAKATAG